MQDSYTVHFKFYYSLLKTIKNCIYKHVLHSTITEMLDTYLLAMQDAENYLTFLHSLSDMGAAMRRVMADTLTDKNLYKTLINMHVDPGRIITSPVHSGTGNGQKPMWTKAPSL